MSEKEYNAEKLHKELLESGLEIDGVTSDGRVDWKLIASPEKLALAEQIKNAHVAVSLNEKLHLAYRKNGLDGETLVFALWEKIMENNALSADQIQGVIHEIKAEITAAG